jgi:hypothetical protein
VILILFGIGIYWFRKRKYAGNWELKVESWKLRIENV